MDQFSPSTHSDGLTWRQPNSAGADGLPLQISRSPLVLILDDIPPAQEADIKHSAVATSRHAVSPSSLIVDGRRRDVTTFSPMPDIAWPGSGGLGHRHHHFVPALPFGGINRHVGLTQERLQLLAEGLSRGDAYASRYHHLGAGRVHRCRSDAEAHPLSDFTGLSHIRVGQQAANSSPPSRNRRSPGRIFSRATATNCIKMASPPA